MLTKDDIRRLIEVFATREDLKQEIQRLDEKMVTKDQFKRVIEMLDEVMGEVKTVREEQSIHANQHEEIHERLDKLQSAV